jgi:hypothetical protein
LSRPQATISASSRSFWTSTPEDKDRHRQEIVQIQLDAFRHGRDKSKQSLARKTLVSMFGEAEQMISQARANGKPS